MMTLNLSVIENITIVELYVEARSFKGTRKSFAGNVIIP
jgi:hypothetical protein